MISRFLVHFKSCICYYTSLFQPNSIFLTNVLSLVSYYASAHSLTVCALISPSKTNKNEKITSASEYHFTANYNISSSTINYLWRAVGGMPHHLLLCVIIGWVYSSHWYRHVVTKLIWFRLET